MTTLFENGQGVIDKLHQQMNGDEMILAIIIAGMLSMATEWNLQERILNELQKHDSNSFNDWMIAYQEMTGD